MKRISKTTVRSLMDLIREGETRGSAFTDKDLAGHLLMSGSIEKVQLTRSSFKYVLKDEDAFRLACRDYSLRLKNIERAYRETTGEEVPRKPSEIIDGYGFDHIMKRNVWHGFFLKPNHDLAVSYRGRPRTIPAGEGFLVEDGDDLDIPDIRRKTLWIVENYECFLNLSWMERFAPQEKEALVVCRFPQVSVTAREKYCSWPVRKKHYFGDLDLAGINIFQTEYAVLTGAGAYLIPETMEEDIRQKGSTRVFENQWEKNRNIKGLSEALRACIATIIRNRKGLLQENYLL